MGQVNVTISGKIYRMACDDGQEEHLESLGEQLSDTIELLRSQFGEIGDQRLTVMAAITLADRYSESEHRITALEAEQTEVQQRMADPALYQRAQQDVARLKARLDELEAEIEAAMLRWEELESRAAG